jgi:hypothetical protein
MLQDTWFEKNVAGHLKSMSYLVKESLGDDITFDIAYSEYITASSEVGYGFFVYIRWASDLDKFDI